MVIRTRKEVSSPNDDLCRMNCGIYQPITKQWGGGKERRSNSDQISLVPLDLLVIMTKLLSSKCSEFPDLITFRSVSYCSFSLGKSTVLQGRKVCFSIQAMLSI